MSNLLAFLNARRKAIAALLTVAIGVVVAQEQLPHPFTGNWWVALLTGFGVVLGVYVSPNTLPATAIATLLAPAGVAPSVSVGPSVNAGIPQQPIGAADPPQA